MANNALMLLSQAKLLQALRFRLQRDGIGIGKTVTAAALYKAAAEWMAELARDRNRKQIPIRSLVSMEYVPCDLFSYLARVMELREELSAAFAAFGYEFDKIASLEGRIPIGEGKVGKRAYRTLCALTERDFPCIGYGLCYSKNRYRERLIEGEKVQIPEGWIEETPFLKPRPEKMVRVIFGGTVKEIFTEKRMYVRHEGGEIISAMPMDIALPCKDENASSVLRLWRASAKGRFAKGISHEAYLQERIRRQEAEVITERPYRNAENETERLLRLKQAYFLASASMQDMMRYYESIRENSIWLNDEGVYLCIPELMRILMDEQGKSWDEAVIAIKKAVGCIGCEEQGAPFPIECEMLRRLLPRIFSILAEFDRRSPEYSLIDKGYIQLSRLKVLLFYASA